MAVKETLRVWRWMETPYREVFFDTPLQYRRLLRLLPVFYAWAAWQTFTRLDIGWTLSPPEDTPLWPMFFTEWLPWRYAGMGVLALLAVGCVGAILKPRCQWARGAACAGIFLWMAMVYSHVPILYRAYTTMNLCLFFALMPNLPRPEDATEDVRRRALLLAFAGTCFVFFTYSWSGMLKVWGALLAIFQSNDTVYDFGVVPLHLLNSIYEFEKPVFLAEFVIDHSALFTLGFFAAIYMEVVTIACVFRVHLLRWWFGVLAAFHCMTALTMGVFFLTTTVVMILMLFLTPFSRGVLDWRSVLGELPWFGPLLSALIYKLDSVRRLQQRVWIFADPACPLSRQVVARVQRAGLPKGVSIEDRHATAIEELHARAPLYCEGRGLIVVSDRRSERRVRSGAEAALFLALATGRHAVWATLLLLAPIPFSDGIYRAIACAMRASKPPIGPDASSN